MVGVLSFPSFCWEHAKRSHCQFSRRARAFTSFFRAPNDLHFLPSYIDDKLLLQIFLRIHCAWPGMAISLAILISDVPFFIRVIIQKRTLFTFSLIVFDLLTTLLTCI